MPYSQSPVENVETTIQNGAQAQSKKDAALSYAARGIPVFPVANGGKRPLTEHGYLDATADPVTITVLWDKNPDANIGIPTGKVSGIVAVDIDPRNGGDIGLADLEASYGKLPDTVEVHTGGGGRHLWFAYPAGVDIPSSVSFIGPGIDICSDGKYIVAPCSIHQSGNAYEFELSSSLDDIPPADLPEWLIAVIQDAAGTAAKRSKIDTDGPIPEGERK
jgi:hypothetical protein